MTASAKNLTEQSIRDLSGAAVFQRGYVYYNEGRARVVSQNKTTAKIMVQGSEEYAVTLKHTSRQFEASCHCPAAQGFDFCKHCVAASLLYLDLLSQKETLKNSSGDALLQAYLTGLPREQLVDALIDHISRNPITLQNWMLRAETAAEKLDARALKKHITAAIPYNRDLYRYQQVQAYFNKIEALLERLQVEEKQLEPDQILKLVDYAVTRIHRAMETIDDSGGFRNRALRMLAELHENALKKSTQTTRQKADYLLRIYLGEERDFYPEIPESYIATIEQETLDLFYHRLHQRWESLPELDPEGSDHKHFDRKLDYLHTLAPLLKKVRAEKNTKKEIHYLEKSATNVRDMVALSALCAETGDIAAAHLWLSKAESLSDQSGFRADHDSITDQKIEMHILENNSGQAMEIRWQQFEEKRTFEAYLRLNELAKRLNIETGLYEKALSLLQTKPASSDTHNAANDLVRLHLHEKQYTAARHIANDHRISVDLLEQIIFEDIDEHKEILPLLNRAVEFYIDKKNLQGYEDAVELLKNVHKAMKSRGRKHLIRFIENLIESHKAKRNLVALIEQEFELK